MTTEWCSRWFSTSLKRFSIHGSAVFQNCHVSLRHIFYSVSICAVNGNATNQTLVVAPTSFASKAADWSDKTLTSWKWCRLDLFSRWICGISDTKSSAMPCKVNTVQTLATKNECRQRHNFFSVRSTGFIWKHECFTRAHTHTLMTAVSSALKALRVQYVQACVCVFPHGRRASHKILRST